MKSNKNNKKSGLLSVFLTICLVVLVAGWLVTTAYISKQTEEHVRSVLAQSESQHASMWLELVGYKRDFFNASFRVKLHAKDKQLDEALEGLVFRTNVKHGPLVFNDTNIQLATAHFHSFLDNSRVSENMRDVVVRLFGDVNPVNANMVVDYQLNQHYQLDLNAFEYQTTDLNLMVSASSIQGVIKTKGKIEVQTEQNPIKLKFDEIEFKQGSESLQLFRNELALNMFSDEQNQLTTSFLVTDDAKYTGMNVNLDNLRLKQLFKLMVLYEDRYNNEQQIAWTLDSAAQYLEGQEHLFSLLFEKENLALPDTDALLSQLFEHGSNDISFSKIIEDTDLAYK